MLQNKITDFLLILLLNNSKKKNLARNCFKFLVKISRNDKFYSKEKKVIN